MKILETKPNIYTFKLNKVNFLFRIWEDDILLLYPEAIYNVSFKYKRYKYCKRGDIEYRYDTYLNDEIKNNPIALDRWIKFIAKGLARKYNEITIN